MSRAVALLFVACCLPLAAQAQPNSSSAAIANGTPTGDYPHAAGLNLGGGTCSGNLITPRIVLTAAHCIEDLGGLNNVEVVFGDDIWGQGNTLTTRGVDSVWWHPSYEAGGGIGDGDIGTMVLRAPVTDFAPTRIRLLPLTLWDVCANGECGSDVPVEVRVVGYGSREGDGPAGFKYTAVYDLGGLGGDYGQSDDFIAVDDSEEGLCPGDSGAPYFFEHEAADGSTVLEQWAVHSGGGGSRTQCSTGDEFGTNVGLFIDDILDQVEAVHGTRDLCELNGWYGDGFCDPHCPSRDQDCPNSCGSSVATQAPRWSPLVLLLGAGLIAFRRRRR